ncbi:MAG: hypothetical protein FWG73_03580 [Planctomycetaceae bacterium]|nr:hypothetical protein [Planctomycetaceae bacterium]
MSIEEVAELPPFEVQHDAVNSENSPLVDRLSEPIIGQWNVLVSQTNWEKGSLILNWRNELIAAGLPNTVYSDEAWARHVGNVSAQHVGRLRRVSERFGTAYPNFAGLYWSHFSVALDWDDAELWLEGAVQNSWSVAQMRVQRWETLGGSDDQKPLEKDVIVADFDEESYSHSAMPDRIEGRTAEIGAVEGFDASSIAVPDIDEKPVKKKEQTKKDKAKHTESTAGISVPRTGELLMSLREISNFPADLADSLELLKVAILNHKLAGWQSISAEQVGRALEMLKMLTVAED